MHPPEDSDLDQQRMTLADPGDTRTLAGRELCKDLHRYDYLNQTDYKEGENWKIASGTRTDHKGNLYCPYGECSVCALRLASWLRWAAVCACINKPNPEVVRRALVLIQEWEIRRCTVAIFRKAYRQTQYAMKRDAKARTSTSSWSTSSSQPTEVVIVDSDEEQERRMVKYVNARRWALGAKRLLALARLYEFEQVRRFMEDFVTAADALGFTAKGNDDQIYQKWLHWREQQITDRNEEDQQ